MRVLLLLAIALVATSPAASAANPSEVACIGHRGDDDPRLGGIPREVAMPCETARCDSLFVDPVGTYDFHSLACDDPQPLPETPIGEPPVVQDVLHDPLVSVAFCLESRGAVLLRNVAGTLAQEDCSVHGQDRCVFSRGTEGEFSVYSIACSGDTIGPI